MNLVEPLLQKPHTIDALYTLQAVPPQDVDFLHATRLALDENATAEMQRAQARQEPTFNTEIFWTTAKCLSVGFRPAASHYHNLFQVRQRKRER